MFYFILGVIYRKRVKSVDENSWEECAYIEQKLLFLKYVTCLKA